LFLICICIFCFFSSSLFLFFPQSYPHFVFPFFIFSQNHIRHPVIAVVILQFQNLDPSFSPTADLDPDPAVKCNSDLEPGPLEQCFVTITFKFKDIEYFSSCYRLILKGYFDVLYLEVNKDSKCVNYVKKKRWTTDPYLHCGLGRSKNLF
jgi:hypothetical protein